MLCVIHKHMNLTSYYKTFSQKEHVFFYDFHEKKKQYKKTVQKNRKPVGDNRASCCFWRDLFICSGRTSVSDSDDLWQFPVLRRTAGSAPLPVPAGTAGGPEHPGLPPDQ